MTGLLLVNPRSGDDAVPPAQLVEAAAALGIETRVLERGDDASALARAAAAAGATALGMAGGDGSLGAVAAVAIEHGLPFACVPYGTRNHFARDAGLDRNDPLGALAAFAGGGERRVDACRIEAADGAARVFLNNVSLGAYARLVQHRERHRRRGLALARLRALALAARERHALSLVVDGTPAEVRVLLLASNAIGLGPLTLGVRERLDEGLLHVYAAEGLLPGAWRELPPRSEAAVSARQGSLVAAVDGEPVRFELPLRVRVLPGALRLLVPSGG